MAALPPTDIAEPVPGTIDVQEPLPSLYQRVRENIGEKWVR